MKITKPLTNWKKAMNEKMNETEFHKWMSFFRGVNVTVGNGKTVWNLTGGYWNGSERKAVVFLKRDDPRRNGFGYYKTTVDAERVRYSA